MKVPNQDRQHQPSPFETLRLSLRLSGGGSSPNFRDPSSTSPNGYEFVRRLSWVDKLELALGASRGVNALVSLLPGYSHNDLKSANFLVHRPVIESQSISSSDEHFTWIVKIADIEFASKGITPEYMVEAETPNWTAPEILGRTANVSPASDVYALACVLFEIESRMVPFDGEGNRTIVQHVIQGKRPSFGELPSNTSNIERDSRLRFRDLVSSAWAQDPFDRPSAASIAQMISEERSSYCKSLAAI